MNLGPALGGLDSELNRFASGNFQRLGFAGTLEDEFESNTSITRSHRLWLEGLLAILVANGCLLVDYVFVQEKLWQTMILRTLLITPVAVLVNSLMRRNPQRRLREGSVAAGTTLIGFIALYAQGNATATGAMFGFVCVLITMLFADVMMRLRFPYAVGATSLMLAGVLWFLARAQTLQPSEKVVGASLMMIAVAIMLLANYSMEREERVNYLLARRSEMQSTEILKMNAALLRLSGSDKLTGLPNRRSFEERFEELWNDAELTQRPLSQIIIDVDHFKQLNDVKGHLYGDEVLERIASLLPQALRGQTDFVARFGGEEFIVLLPGAEEERALIIAERIRGLVEFAGTPPQKVDGENFLMWSTVSCGVSTCVPGALMERKDLLRAADRALYKAKADGRNRVRFEAGPQLSAWEEEVCGRTSPSVHTSVLV